MDIQKLQERIDKAQEKIDKKYSTIEKTKARIEKLTAQIATFKYKTREELRTIPAEERKEKNFYNPWEVLFKLEVAEDSIKANYKEIKKIEGTLKKYQDQMIKENNNLNKVKNIPEILKNLIEKIIEENDKLAINDPNEVRSSEEIHKDNVDFANYLVLNLIARTENVVGEIISWNELRITTGSHHLPVFNGIVNGTKGIAIIETIEAGGWNVQRWHLRVLVKKI